MKFYIQMNIQWIKNNLDKYGSKMRASLYISVYRLLLSRKVWFDQFLPIIYLDVGNCWTRIHNLSFVCRRRKISQISYSIHHMLYIMMIMILIRITNHNCYDLFDDYYYCCRAARSWDRNESVFNFCQFWLKKNGNNHNDNVTVIETLAHEQTLSR